MLWPLFHDGGTLRSPALAAVRRASCDVHHAATRTWLVTMAGQDEHARAGHLCQAVGDGSKPPAGVGQFPRRILLHCAHPGLTSYSDVFAYVMPCKAARVWFAHVGLLSQSLKCWLTRHSGEPMLHGTTKLQLGPGCAVCKR